MEQNKVKNKVRPQTKHLIPLKKGETANPNGRPLGQRNYSTIYREALIKLGEANNKDPGEIELELIQKGILNARNGDYRFYKDVLDRTFGSVPEEKPPENKVTYNFLFSKEVQAEVDKIEDVIKAKLRQNYVPEN